MPDPIADISGSLTSGLNTIAMLLNQSRESKESKTPSLTLEQYNNYFKKIDVLTEKVEQSNKQIDRVNLNLASLVSGLSNTNTVLRQIYDFVSKRTQPLTTPQLPVNTNNALVEGNNRQQQPLDLTPAVVRKELAPSTNTFTSVVPGQSELTQETEQFFESQSIKKLLALATTQAEGITSIDKNVHKILKKLGNDEDSITTKQAGGGGVLGALEALALYELMRRALADKNKPPAEPPAEPPPAGSRGKIPTGGLPPERVQLIQPELPASTRPALDYKNSMAERPTLPKPANASEVSPSGEGTPEPFEVLPPEAEPAPTGKTPAGSAASNTAKTVSDEAKALASLKAAKYIKGLGWASLLVTGGLEAMEANKDYKDIEEREKLGKLSQQQALGEKGQMLGERGGTWGTGALIGTAAAGAAGVGLAALSAPVWLAALGTLAAGGLAVGAADLMGLTKGSGKLIGGASKAITPWAYDTFSNDKDKGKDEKPVDPYGVDRPQGDGFYNPRIQKERYKNYRPESFESKGGEFKPSDSGTFKPAPTEQLQKLVIEQPKEATLSLKEIADQGSTAIKKYDGMIDALGMLTNALLTNSGNNDQAIANIQAQLNAARSAQPAGGPNNSSEQVDISETSVPIGIPTMRQKFNN